MRFRSEDRYTRLWKKSIAILWKNDRAYQSQKTDPAKPKELASYLQSVRREQNFYALDIYASDGKPLLLISVSENNPPQILGIEALRKQPQALFENTKAGELIRTVGTFPFGAKSSEAEAFVVISTLIPANLSQKLANISRGIEEYQQIKLLNVRFSYPII
ncbi:MAG: hypothetical protein HC887_08505 [Desulfobacteraceae bacterium]|nr:hypothetical protein [Desulfobacteraceae bacterium]